MDFVVNDTFVKDHEFAFRAVRFNIFRINLSFNLRQALKNIQVHFDTQFRYATFQKFPINRWENLCDYLKGKRSEVLLAVVFSNLQNYTNVNHPCPYTTNETIFLKADRYEFDAFTFKYFLPAGDFRLNITYAEGAERNMVCRLQIHFTISDHRVWN